MRFHLVTLFPEFFSSPLQAGLLARAQENDLVSVDFYDPRSFTCDKHHCVDDRPYGGGPGMVMLIEPLMAALRSIPQPGRIFALSPAGRPFDQQLARELTKESDITLICGRYEGFDGRLQHLAPVEYISVGDAVLNGGETPALAVIEAVGRLLPGFMGKESSGDDESFSAGLLEYPHYTRPETYEGYCVPDVLRSGNHAQIAAWRREQALKTTLHYRPELLCNALLNSQDAAVLADIPRLRAGRNLFLILVHYPVVLEGKNNGASSITNLDIHDIARITCTYGLGGFYITTPLQDQKRILEDILHHWQNGPAAKSNPHRAHALGTVHWAQDMPQAVEQIQHKTGQQPFVLASSARWQQKKSHPPTIPCAEIRQRLQRQPVALVLGTGHGLAPDLLHQCDAMTAPIRFLDAYNHLSVRAAAAILTDRILGDIY